MKATITNCLAEMVETKFGKEKWAEIVRRAGMQAQAGMLRQSSMDVPDDQVGTLLRTACVVLGVTPEQAYDAFGEYWCCHYQHSCSLYFSGEIPAYDRCKTA